MLTPRHSLGWRVGGQLTLRISFIVSSRRGDLDCRIVDRVPRASSVPYCHSFAPTNNGSQLQPAAPPRQARPLRSSWRLEVPRYPVCPSQLEEPPFRLACQSSKSSLYSILADFLPDPPSQRPLHPHPLLPRPHRLQTRPCRPLSTHDNFFTLWLSRMRLQSP